MGRGWRRGRGHLWDLLGRWLWLLPLGLVGGVGAIALELARVELLLAVGEVVLHLCRPGVVAWLLVLLV